MPDLETRFRRLDRVRGPDLWPDIEARQPRPMPEGSTARRLAAAAVALALAAGGAVLVARAFLGGDRPSERSARPVATPPAPVDPVVDVTLPIEWPSSIVYGAGSVWVAASSNDGTPAGTIYRIDPHTAEILAEIPSPVVPGWETGGGAMEVADGDLWVAGGGSSGRLVRVDGATNRVVQEISVQGRFLGDVAVDQRGVWVSVFVEGGGAIDLVRLDPESGDEEARFRMESSYAREVLAVEGTLWLHERRTHGATVGGSGLTRVDPETGRVLARVELRGGAGMVTAVEGSIWAPSWTSEAGNMINRLDPLTNELITIPSGSLEFVLDVGEGGIWGVARRGQDRIVRFNPVKGQVDARVEIPGEAITLAVAPGSVWVVHYREGVTRVELRPA
jgi:sugar lactone lactonase YvrE